MDNLETIFDKAIYDLKQGKTLQEVLAMYPEHKDQLAPLLALSTRLNAFPKKTVPEPARQRKYILAAQEHWWIAVLHISKFANVSIGVLLIVSALAGTGYAASRSVAGETLFKVKTFAEQTQVALATSPEEKANLQVEIAQKRLTEAQAVLSNPQADPQQEQAALNELLSQTQSAIETTSKAAKTNPGQPKNQQAVTSLASITKQQQDLLTQIKPQTALASEATTALKQVAENVGKVEAIQQYIATASKEETLTNLNPTSTPETLEGVVKGISTTTATSTEIIKEIKETGTSASSTKKSYKEQGDQSTTTAPSTSTSDPNTATASFIPESPTKESPF